MRALCAQAKEEPLMNKRIVSLFLSLIMVLGVILTGCSGGEDVGNTEDVTEEASTSTVTPKMYVVSEKEVSEETAKRINTAFNKITKSNFKTQVNICFCTYDTYYETLNAVFAENERYAALKEEAAKHLRDAKRAAKNEGIDISYLAYAMESMNLSKYFSGATIPHIYFRDYSVHSYLEDNGKPRLTRAVYPDKPYSKEFFKDASKVSQMRKSVFIKSLSLSTQSGLVCEKLVAFPILLISKIKLS